MAVFAVMFYRVTVTALMYPVAGEFLTYSSVKLLISLSAATLNLIAIVLLNKVGRLHPRRGREKDRLDDTFVRSAASTYRVTV